MFPDGQPLNMILDDGGDLTNLVHENHSQFLTGDSGGAQLGVEGVVCRLVLCVYTLLVWGAYNVHKWVVHQQPHTCDTLRVTTLEFPTHCVGTQWWWLLSLSGEGGCAV